jgi:hypothetical protein
VSREPKSRASSLGFGDLGRTVALEGLCSREQVLDAEGMRRKTQRLLSESLKASPDRPKPPSCLGDA